MDQFLGGVFLIAGALACLSVPIGLLILVLKESAKTSDLRRTVENLGIDVLALKQESRRLNQLMSVPEQGPGPSSKMPESYAPPEAAIEFEIGASQHPASRKPRLKLAVIRARQSPERPTKDHPTKDRPTKERPTKDRPTKSLPVSPSLPSTPGPQPQSPIASLPPGATGKTSPPVTAAQPPSSAQSSQGLGPLAAEPGPLPPVPFRPARRITVPPPNPSSPQPAGAQPSKPSAPPVIPSRFTPASVDWESLIGGRLLNWIGALATIIGIGFFLRYAFQNNWVTLTMRVAIGFLIGGALLIGGNISYSKGFRIFSQGLIGAGISALYLSVYASFDFYHLAPQRIAFLMMSVVTVVTFLQALRFNSLAISILGWLGGFLTPFLLSTGVSNEVGLFSYIALLIAGLLAIAAFKRAWVALQPLTLGATYVIYVLWYSQYYAPSDMPTTATFLSIFWLLFLLLDVYWATQSSDSLLELREACGAFNAIFFYTALYIIVDSGRHDLTGITTLTLGGVYFAIAMGIERVKWNSAQFNRYLLTAIALLVLATAFQFTGFTTVALWSIEAAALIWCANHWKLRSVTVAAVLLYCATFARLFLTDGWDHYGSAESFRLLLNPRALAFITLAAASAFGAVVSGAAHKEKPNALKSALHYMWCLLVFVLITVEVSDEFGHLMHSATGDSAIGLKFDRGLVLAMMWMLCSLPLVWYGLESKILPITLSGLLVMGTAAVGLVIRGAVYTPVIHFYPVLNARMAVFVVMLAALVVQLNWVNKHRRDYKWGTTAVYILRFFFGALLWVLCTAEVDDYFRSQIMRQGPEAVLRFRSLMAFGIVWTLYAIGLAALAAKKKIVPFAICAGLVACFAIFVSVVDGFEFVPLGTFTPLFNWRALSVVTVIAGLLLIATFLPHDEDQPRWKHELFTAVAVTVSLLIVYLLSVETKDYFGKQLLLAETSSGSALDQLSQQMSGAVDGLTNLRQMALSLVWVGYSILLIGFGIWRRMLSLRLVAISLVTIAILKIFFYDLRFLQTGYRIISFIGLGLILLAISFLYQRFKSVITGPGAQTPTNNPLPQQ